MFQIKSKSERFHRIIAYLDTDDAVSCLVHVSATLLCRLRVCASHAIVQQTFVKSSFVKSWVHLSLRAFRMTSTFELWVVNRTMISRGVTWSTFFRPIRCDRTISRADSSTSSFHAAMPLTMPSVCSCRASGMLRIRTVFRHECCSRSPVFSSKAVTLTFKSRISVSFFAMMSPGDFVSVSVSPRSISAT